MHSLSQQSTGEGKGNGSQGLQQHMLCCHGQKDEDSLIQNYWPMEKYSLFFDLRDEDPDEAEDEVRPGHP